MIDWTKKYNPEAFKKQGYALIDQLAAYLDKSIHREGPVTQHRPPDEELDYWMNYEIETLDQFYEDLLNHSIQLHHPRYIGHQVSAPLPDIALAGLYSSLLNNGMGIYEMGEGPTAIERAVVKEMCHYIGYKDQAGGFMTSGGTLANLTALLAARRYAMNHIKGQEKELIVIVSEQAHFCVERACGTMGINSGQIKKIPVNTQYQMDLGLLTQIIADVDIEKQHIMAIVVSCCSTATGSYDDLSSILALCASKNIWIHVDGAHGGSAILSEKYKHLLAGVDQAHSIIIDAHKMMLTSSLATFVLFRNESDSYNIFNQDASYLFSQADQEWFNLAKRTYETTKYMMSIKTFVALRYHGKSAIETFIDRQYNLTKELASYLKSQPDYEIAHEPMSNILCFRYTPSNMNLPQIDDLNKSIRSKLLNDGKWYIVQTQLHNQTYLRVSIMNALTTMNDLMDLIEDIRAYANS